MAVAERGSRRSVRETDQPGFVDHPDRLDDALKYRRRGDLAGQRRRIADAIGRGSSLSDPRQPTYWDDPKSDSTTTCLSEPDIRNTFRSHPLRGDRVADHAMRSSDQPPGQPARSSHCVTPDHWPRPRRGQSHLLKRPDSARKGRPPQRGDGHGAVRLARDPPIRSRNTTTRSENREFGGRR